MIGLNRHRMRRCQKPTLANPQGVNQAATPAQGFRIQERAFILFSGTQPAPVFSPNLPEPVRVSPNGLNSQCSSTVSSLPKMMLVQLIDADYVAYCKIPIAMPHS